MAYQAAFLALADPTRRRVFEELRRGPCSVGKIAARMPVSRPAVSQHLGVLKKAGLDLKSIDLFEVNEAFASVVLAWAKETGADLQKTNVNGGAIAVGHPLGASGAILMNRLLFELERRDLRYGLETMCCGGGIGTATIIDRVVE